MFTRGKVSVRRSDLQRGHEIAESAEGQRHNGQEDHDCSVHGAEGVIEVRHDDTNVAVRVLPDHVIAEQAMEKIPNNGDRVARISNLPAHDHHQAETEKEKHQRGNAVLDADDLVIGGKDILLPKPRLLMARVVGVRVCVCCGLHGCL